MLKQLSVFVENERGSLAKVTGELKAHNINIRAIASFDTPEFGIMRMVVDDVNRAREVLMAKGFVVKITEVLAIELVDRPGDLDRVFRIISDADLEINYIYSFVLRENNAPLMVFSVNDMVKAEKVLAEHNIVVVEEQN